MPDPIPEFLREPKKADGICAAFCKRAAAARAFEKTEKINHSCCDCTENRRFIIKSGGFHCS